MKLPIPIDNRRVASQAFITPWRRWHDDFSIIQPFKIQSVVATGKVDARFAIPQKVGQKKQVLFRFLSG